MENLEINEKLKQLRKSKGLSQTQLAKKMNVSNKLISKWETGASLPSIDYLKRYSEIFSVSIDKLIGNEVHYDCAIDYSKIKVEHKKKWTQYIGVTASCIIFIAYIISAFTACFVVPNEQLPIWAKCVIAIVPTMFIVTVIVLLINRIKEINGGEEDDSSKY